MFAKLLNYEWKGSRRVLGILCAVTLGSGLTLGLTCVYLTGREWQQSNVLAAIVMLMALMIIGFSAAGGFLYLIWRFYQSRFTDEGYLSFTLPVNNHQQLLAALVNILRGSFLVILAAIGAIVLAGLIYMIYVIVLLPQDVNWEELLQAVREYLPVLWDAINWMGLLQLLALGLTGLISGIVTLMFCITLGVTLARKHKFLTTAAAYYGIGLVNSWCLVVWGFDNSGQGLWNYGMWRNLISIAAGYFLMHWLVEKKLNLS